MGRPPPIWLLRAYEILADGEWHSREKVIREISKVVPPALAYRRGIRNSVNPDNATRDWLIMRGARDLSLRSLYKADHVQHVKQDKEWLVRRGDVVNKPVPMLFIGSTEDDATHVLVEIEDYHALELEGGEFVRWTG